MREPTLVRQFPRLVADGMYRPQRRTAKGSWKSLVTGTGSPSSDAARLRLGCGEVEGADLEVTEVQQRIATTEGCQLVGPAHHGLADPLGRCGVSADGAAGSSTAVIGGPGAASSPGRA